MGDIVRIPTEPMPKGMWESWLVLNNPHPSGTVAHYRFAEVFYREQSLAYGRRAAKNMKVALVLMSIALVAQIVAIALVVMTS